MLELSLEQAVEIWVDDYNWRQDQILDKESLLYEMSSVVALGEKMNVQHITSVVNNANEVLALELCEVIDLENQNPVVETAMVLFGVWQGIRTFPIPQHVTQGLATSQESRMFFKQVKQAYGMVTADTVTDFARGVTAALANTYVEQYVDIVPADDRDENGDDVTNAG